MNDTTRKAVTQRLRSIEGHVGGLRRMADEDAYCIDLLQQVQAIHGALDKVAQLILANHFDTCVTAAIRGENPAERERVVGELLAVFGASAGRPTGRASAPQLRSRAHAPAERTSDR